MDAVMGRFRSCVLCCGLAIAQLADFFYGMLVAVGVEPAMAVPITGLRYEAGSPQSAKVCMRVCVMALLACCVRSMCALPAGPPPPAPTPDERLVQYL